MNAVMKSPAMRCAAMQCPVGRCAAAANPAVKSAAIAIAAPQCAAAKGSACIRQSGLTLPELLVALALGVFLIAGLVNVFLGNRQTAQAETALARLQENGRLALELLARDVRDAMYIGCGSGHIRPVVIARDTVFNGIRGWELTEAGWSPPLPARLETLSRRPLPAARVGSDVLHVQHGARPAGGLSPSASVSGSGAVPIAGNPACLRRGQRALIADCARAHVFRITNAPSCSGGATRLQFGAAANQPASIRPGYSTAAELYRFHDKTWFVSATGRMRRTIPVFALYRRDNGRNEEIIEGVEYLQVLYGQRLANGALRYVAADDAGLDWSEVTAVRIDLLLQSFEPVLSAADERAYQVLDESIGGEGAAYTHNGDRALRRVFSTTAVLRNRAAPPPIEASP